jgi:cysteine desulfurase
MIYFDNSATTKISDGALAKMTQVMREHFGNPSSLHTLGFEAEQKLLDARKTVAGMLKAKSEEIIFTSGGTEANNMALFGCAHAQKRRGQHIITTAVEHSSVLAPMEQLEKEGFLVTRLMPDENGMITAAQVADACRPDTVLVSVMLVAPSPISAWNASAALPRSVRISRTLWLWLAPS